MFGFDIFNTYLDVFMTVQDNKLAGEPMNKNKPKKTPYLTKIHSWVAGFPYEKVRDACRKT